VDIVALLGRGNRCMVSA